jgi:hypothetical protein
LDEQFRTALDRYETCKRRQRAEAEVAVIQTKETRYQDGESSHLRQELTQALKELHETRSRLAQSARVQFDLTNQVEDLKHDLRNLEQGQNANQVLEATETLK